MTTFDSSAVRRDLTSVCSPADIRRRISLSRDDDERIDGLLVAGGTGGSAPFERTELRDVDLRHVDLRAFLDLSGQAFVGLRLIGSQAPNLSLSYAPESKFDAASLPHLKGAGACFRHATAIGADLRHAYLEGADLRQVMFRGASLVGACLRGADLRGADLRDADLRGADLGGAILDDAMLRGAQIRLGLESPKLDVLSLLRANWRFDTSSPVTRDLMAFDAGCHPAPSAFDVFADDGTCPYDGRERVLRAVGFPERREPWIEGLGEKMEASPERIGNAPIETYSAPQPLPLLLRLLCEQCVVTVDNGDLCGPNLEGLRRAMRGLWRTTLRYRVDVSRTVNVRSTRTDYATVTVEAADEDEARTMVEDAPEDYVDDWNYGDDDHEDEDVETIEVTSVDED